MESVNRNLDPTSSTPLYEQLYRHIIDEISRGIIKTGERLPSKRDICQAMHVSRSTVETAYGMLVSEGYVIPKAKSGYYVSDFIPAAPVSRGTEPVLEALPDASAPEFDFSTASVDTSGFPYSSWAKLNREVVYSRPELLQRGHRQGDPELRMSLCRFLSEYRGVVCSAEQIVVGAGMEYLMSALLELFDRDTVFALEDPGYASVSSALRSRSMPVQYIPVRENGLDIALLENSDASVVYVTPSHQFPTGVTMPAGQRSHLLHWASGAADRYIIEDDYDSEFRYSGRPIPSLHSMGGEKVIYAGTFSRSIAPSIRLAYMVLPLPLLERYRSQQSHNLQTVSRYEQAVVSRFLDTGIYTRHLRRLVSLYRSRRDALCRALSEIPGTQISGSEGGIHFLLHVTGRTEDELIRSAKSKGIILTGLSAYCQECTPRKSAIVIGFGGLQDEKIPEAASILRSVWTQNT